MNRVKELFHFFVVLIFVHMQLKNRNYFFDPSLTKIGIALVKVINISLYVKKNIVRFVLSLFSFLEKLNAQKFLILFIYFSQTFGMS